LVEKILDSHPNLGQEGRSNIQCRQRWVRTLDPDHASNALTAGDEEHNAGYDKALDSVPV
jgi:hypothetical protein